MTATAAQDVDTEPGVSHSFQSATGVVDGFNSAGSRGNAQIVA